MITQKNIEFEMTMFKNGVLKKDNLSVNGNIGFVILYCILKANSQKRSCKKLLLYLFFVYASDFVKR